MSVCHLDLFQDSKVTPVWPNGRMIRAQKTDTKEVFNEAGHSERHSDSPRSGMDADEHEHSKQPKG
jgi:hypothetical protein